MGGENASRYINVPMHAALCNTNAYFRVTRHSCEYHSNDYVLQSKYAIHQSNYVCIRHEPCCITGHSYVIQSNDFVLQSNYCVLQREVFPKTRIVMGLLTILGALVRGSLVGMAEFWGSLPPGHIVVVGKDYF